MKKNVLISILFIFIASSFLNAQSSASSSSSRRRRARNYELTISTNVRNSSIVVTGEGGNTSNSFISSGTGTQTFEDQGRFSKTIQSGTYTVTVTADGYYPETLEVQLNENKTLNINLRLMTASVTITIPRRFYAKNPNARGLVKFYDNGELLRGGPVYELTPGQHTLRIESGGLWIQGTFRFEPGKQYTLEPELSLNLK